MFWSVKEFLPLDEVGPPPGGGLSRKKLPNFLRRFYKIVFIFVNKSNYEAVKHCRLIRMAEHNTFLNLSIVQRYERDKLGLRYLDHINNIFKASIKSSLHFIPDVRKLK